MLASDKGRPQAYELLALSAQKRMPGGPARWWTAMSETRRVSMAPRSVSVPTTRLAFETDSPNQGRQARANL